MNEESIIFLTGVVLICGFLIIFSPIIIDKIHGEYKE
jgi:hypothetical protein